MFAVDFTESVSTFLQKVGSRFNLNPVEISLFEDSTQTIYLFNETRSCNELGLRQNSILQVLGNLQQAPAPAHAFPPALSSVLPSASVPASYPALSPASNSQSRQDIAFNNIPPPINNFNNPPSMSSPYFGQNQPTRGETYLASRMASSSAPPTPTSSSFSTPNMSLPPVSSAGSRFNQGSQMYGQPPSQQAIRRFSNENMNAAAAAATASVGSSLSSMDIRGGGGREWEGNSSFPHQSSPSLRSAGTYQGNAGNIGARGVSAAEGTDYITLKLSDYEDIQKMTDKLLILSENMTKSTPQQDQAANIQTIHWQIRELTLALNQLKTQPRK